MCIASKPKTCAGIGGTNAKPAATPPACPEGFGNPGSVSPSPISLLHSIPCSTMNAVPKAMVASSQYRVHARSPRCDANTPSTIVNELDSRQAVMIVALVILSLPNGVGQACIEIRL